MDNGNIDTTDRKFWGDTKGPRNEYLRVVYNNTNGLQIREFLTSIVKNELERKTKKSLTVGNNVTKVDGVLSALDRWEANVLCCAETQTAWEKVSVKEKVEKALRRKDQYACLVGSSSAIGACEAYKPGGTMTIVDGNWSSRVTKHVDSNKLGRWSYVTFHGCDDTMFTIITAYRCCSGQTNKTVGTCSSFMQQETLLKQKGVNKSPQEAMIVDLQALIARLIRDDHEILLNIDANELWDVKGSRIQEMTVALGLIDIAKERHGGPVPATYVRKNSARRIDYMLCIEGVQKSVMAMGIATEDVDPVMGDHRPQYLDINVNGLLKLNIHDVCSPTARKLKSSNPKNVEIYLKKVEENFMEHNIFHRVESLWNELDKKVIMTPIQIEKYEAIDRDIYRLSKNAENEIKGHHHMKYVWSPALDAAVFSVQYWKQRQKYFGDENKSTKIIVSGISRGIYDDRDLNMDEIQEELAHAYSHLKEAQDKFIEKRVAFLESLAEKYAAENKIDKASAIRELMDHEAVRELYRTIRLKMNGARPPQMSEVWILNDDKEKKW